MHNVTLTTLKASGNLGKFSEIINEVARNYLPIIDTELSLQDIDIVVCDDASRSIPETGLGGMAYNRNLVMVFVNTNFPDLKEKFEVELKSTLAHELNHSVRWQKVEYGTTLLEALISEGLADHFDVKINKSKPKLWDVALGEAELDRYTQLAKEVWKNPEYNHAEWFFGRGEIPRWAGYSIGYRLVGGYINQFPEKDYKTLTELGAEEFIP